MNEEVVAANMIVTDDVWWCLTIWSYRDYFLLDKSALASGQFETSRKFSCLFLFLDYCT